MTAVIIAMLSIIVAYLLLYVYWLRSDLIKSMDNWDRMAALYNQLKIKYEDLRQSKGEHEQPT